METLVRNLKLLWKSERILGELRVKVVGQKLAVAVLAGLTGLFALGMLNLSVFFAIQQSLGSSIAALLVGLGNLLIAGLLFLAVHRLDGGREARAVEEVRELVLGDIEKDAKAFHSELLHIRDEVSEIRTGIVRLVTNPMDALSPRMLIPATAALSKLVSATSKTTKAKATGATAKTRSRTTRRKATPSRAKAPSKRTQAAPKTKRKTARKS